MAIKAAIFDLDGTLLDTEGFIVSSYEYVCDKAGLRIITKEMIQALGGANLQQTYFHYHPRVNTELLCSMHVDFQLEHVNMVKPFSDTLHVLKWLKSHHITSGIVTARRHNAHQLIREVGITRYFASVVTCEDVENSKPHPEAMLLTLKRLNLQSEEVVYVGDMPADIEMGKLAKVRTVAVGCGLSSFNELMACEPDFYAPRLSDILTLILNMK